MVAFGGRVPFAWRRCRRLGWVTTPLGVFHSPSWCRRLARLAVSLGGLRSGYSAFGCFALLGATRGGSFGIFGYTGGHGASINPSAISRSDISNNGSID